MRSTILSKWAGPLAAALAVAAVSGVIALLTPHVPAPYLLVLYVLVVMAVAVVWGTGMAVFAAVLSVVLFNYLFVNPPFAFHFDDPSNTIGSVAFLAAAVVVGRLAARLRRAALESARLSEEQLALTANRDAGRAVGSSRRRSLRPSRGKSVCCAVPISRAWSTTRRTER